MGVLANACHPPDVIVIHDGQKFPPTCNGVKLLFQMLQKQGTNEGSKHVTHYDNLCLECNHYQIYKSHNKNFVGNSPPHTSTGRYGLGNG